MVFSINGVWAGVVTLWWTENPFNLVRFQERPQNKDYNMKWINEKENLYKLIYSEYLLYKFFKRQK